MSFAPTVFYLFVCFKLNWVTKHFDTFILIYSFQVCDDIDECKGPDNGGCTPNSICHNSMVRLQSNQCTVRVSSLTFYFRPVAFKRNSNAAVPFPPQGSFYCGSCKTGFTGDQVKGCEPELSCGNSLTNPCDTNAQCFRERDGSISCQVGF